MWRWTKWALTVLSRGSQARSLLASQVTALGPSGEESFITSFLKGSRVSTGRWSYLPTVLRNLASHTLLIEHRAAQSSNDDLLLSNKNFSGDPWFVTHAVARMTLTGHVIADLQVCMAQHVGVGHPPACYVQAFRSVRIWLTWYWADLNSSSLVISWKNIYQTFSHGQRWWYACSWRKK